MTKTISKKIIEKVFYELKFFEGDNQYVIYKKDKDKMINKIVKIPEVARFDNEKEAREYFEKIK